MSFLSPELEAKNVGQCLQDQLLERVFKINFGRFFGSFELIWEAKRRGNIRNVILPLRFASQISQNNPKTRRNVTLKTRS